MKWIRQSAGEYVSEDQKFEIQLDLDRRWFVSEAATQSRIGEGLFGQDFPTLRAAKAYFEQSRVAATERL